MSGNFFGTPTPFTSAEPAAIPAPPLNGHDDPPLPVSETDYGVIEAKTGGKPVVEVLPPEFADDALALAFSSSYGPASRYVSQWGRWYLWDGQCWRHDDTLRVRDMARRLCRSYACNAAPNVQKMVTSRKTIDAVLHLAQADRVHAATVNQWDADPWLLNTPAGIVDLRTGDIGPHDPDQHMTKMTTVSPGGDCPLWLRFLDRVTDGDAELVAFLKRVAGYCLTGITREHAMFFAYGTGRNGKGVFLNTLVSILGDYAMTADPDTFTASGQGKHLTVLARLQGARLVVAQETEEGVPWAEARIKSVTGGDPITANFMRQDHFTFSPAFKLFMAGNHKPGLRAVDEAIRARFNLVPFTVTIPPEERDPDLANKLAAEAPGILAWAIEGCHEWQANRLLQPLVVSNATHDYFEAEDIFSQWMAECCRFGNDYHRAGATALYKSWKSWAFQAGEPPISQKRFSQMLEGKGYKSVRSRSGMEFVGISLPVHDTSHEPTEGDFPF